MLIPCLNCGRDIHYVDWSGFEWQNGLTPIQSGWFHTDFFEENCQLSNPVGQPTNQVKKATPAPSDYRITYVCAACGEPLRWGESQQRWEHAKPRNALHARNCNSNMTLFATPLPVSALLCQ